MAMVLTANALWDDRYGCFAGTIPMLTWSLPKLQKQTMFATNYIVMYMYMWLYLQCSLKLPNNGRPSSFI